MAKKLRDVLKSILPMGNEQKKHLLKVGGYIEGEKLDSIKELLKEKKIGFFYNVIETKLVEGISYPQINSLTEDRNTNAFIEDVNSIIEEKAYEKSFLHFSGTAYDNIQKIMAPELQGYDLIRKAILLQLVNPTRFHILLLGDPGTGKTELLRAGQKLSSVNSFGLGSGISGVGLVASKKGKEIIPGLLPMADKGMCCIDELNLMRKEDRGGLLNAMEKGFVSYNKGSDHVKLKADVKILATANPKGDYFVSNNIDLIKSQIPFDPALFSRFHLIFVIRKPNIESFLAIARKIIRQQDRKNYGKDTDFVKRYIEYANKKPAEFDNKFEPMLIDFLERIKVNQKKFLLDITPRTVHGLISLCRARATIELKEKVDKHDVMEAVKIFDQSLSLLGVEAKQ